jgi:hypothetical protein
MNMQVWLSSLSEHLVAAGDESRFLKFKYSPTEEEIDMELKFKHLKSIKIPRLYAALTEQEQALVMTTLSDSGFGWSSDEIIELMTAPHMKQLKLDQGDNLCQIYKFVQAMKKAISLGAGKLGDLLPDVKRADRERSSMIKKIMAARRANEPSKDDVGMHLRSTYRQHNTESTRAACLSVPRCEYARRPGVV